MGNLHFFPKESYRKRDNPWFWLVGPRGKRFWRSLDPWVFLIIGGGCVYQLVVFILIWRYYNLGPDKSLKVDSWLLVALTTLSIVFFLSVLMGRIWRRRIVRSPLRQELEATPAPYEYARAAVWKRIRFFAIASGILQFLFLETFFYAMHRETAFWGKPMALPTITFVAAVFAACFTIGQALRASIMANARHLMLSLTITLIWMPAFFLGRFYLFYWLERRGYLSHYIGSFLSALLLFLLLEAVLAVLRWINLRRIWGTPEKPLLMIPRRLGQKMKWV